MEELKFVAAKLIESTPNFQVGKTEVKGRITLEVDGTVSRLPDEMHRPVTQAVLNIGTIALCLEKAGCTREAAARIIREAATECLDTGTKSREEMTERMKDAEKAIEFVKQSITEQIPQVLRKGRTTVKGTVTVVEAAEAA